MLLTMYWRLGVCRGDYQSGTNDAHSAIFVIRSHLYILPLVISLDFRSRFLSATLSISSAGTLPSIYHISRICCPSTHYERRRLATFGHSRYSRRCASWCALNLKAASLVLLHPNFTSHDTRTYTLCNQKSRGAIFTFLKDDRTLHAARQRPGRFLSSLLGSDHS